MIGFGQRALVVGMNGSGKSELIRFLFAQLRVRRVLVDPKGEWKVAGVPCVRLRARDRAAAEREVEAIDFDAPLVHVQPGWMEREQLEALFRRVAQIPGPFNVWVDECYGVSSASWCPAGLHELVVAGRALDRGVFGATQRPRNIAKELLTEADHLFLFPPLDADDLKESRRGVPFLTQEQAQELAKTLPRHGYLWADRRESAVATGMPLPPELRAWRREEIGPR